MARKTKAQSTELVSVVRPARAPAVRRVDLLEAFLAGRKATTLRAYTADLSDFAGWAGKPSPGAACDWLFALGAAEANATALEYRASLVERGLTPATVSRRLAALRSMSKCARLIGVCSWVLEVESPKVQPYRDTRGPGAAGWRAMLEAAQGEAVKGDRRARRDLALVRLLHDLGLRRSEAAALDLGDIERDEQGTPAAVWITGKGRTAHERFTLPRPTAQALADWLAARGPADGPVFNRLDLGSGPAYRGGAPRLSTEMIRRIVRDLGERAGLSRRVSPHQLRHVAITELLDRTGGDVRRVAKFSRHRDLRTLTVYDDARRDDAGELAALLAGETA
jgi:integrase/recombinase XerC